MAALATFQPSAYGHNLPYKSNRSKSRSRTAVKPILKKIHSPHSERSSLDLDRSWEEQAPRLAKGSLDYSSSGVDVGSTTTPFQSTYSPTSVTGIPRTSRDVSFSLSATDLATPGGRPTPTFSHARSTSGASHASITTTTSARNGSFVHPFQQTPRTSTPPLSFVNSRGSLDVAQLSPLDCSDTINEDDDLIDEVSSYQHTSATPRPSFQRGVGSSSLAFPEPRPSLTSQRTGSFSEPTQPLRSQASRTCSVTNVSGVQGGLNIGTSEAQLTGSTSLTPSPSTTAPTNSSPLMITASSSSSFTHMSSLRSSLDMNGFRIRSRSEVDTFTRQEQVRQARRKFEEKEKAKEEKYAREQNRKRERADTKEAQRQAHRRKGSNNSGLASGRNSVSTETRPSISRKSTGTGRFDSSMEKVDFATQGYDETTTAQEPPVLTDDVHFDVPKRRRTAKHKTNGAWTSFVLWLRTRLLKLSRH